MEGDSGTLIRIQSFPSAFVDPRPVSIWLPPGYDGAKKYAVLYMQDGQMLFDSTITWTQQEWKVDETVSRLLKEKKIRDIIVVGIYNNAEYRWSEYFPQAILDYLPTDLKAAVIQLWLRKKPMADAYLRFIVEELKPHIDTTFSTHSDMSGTFVMGSSMGGIISLYAICAYPDVFGGAACLSTHWPLDIPDYAQPETSFDIPGVFRTYLKSNLPSPGNHRIYFDHGTITLDSAYKPHQLLVDEIMVQKGFTDENWLTREFPGAAHSEVSWAERLHIPLEFLLGTP